MVHRKRNKTILNGTKIMGMEIPKITIRFIDSLNFVQSSLSIFPKTCRFTELKKRDIFLIISTPIPSKKYYGVDQMRQDVRKDFLEWHEIRVQENYIFDFKQELLEYCRSDVDILRRSMLKFRQDFIKLENTDPLQYITIASVCMVIYRLNYFKHLFKWQCTCKGVKNILCIMNNGICNSGKEGPIAVVKNVKQKENYSKMSIAWLDWISKTNGIEIQHPMNGGEKRIGGSVKVDGFFKKKTLYMNFRAVFGMGVKHVTPEIQSIQRIK